MVGAAENRRTTCARVQHLNRLFLVLAFFGLATGAAKAQPSASRTADGGIKLELPAELQGAVALRLYREGEAQPFWAVDDIDNADAKLVKMARAPQISRCGKQGQQCWQIHLDQAHRGTIRVVATDVGGIRFEGQVLIGRQASPKVVQFQSSQTGALETLIRTSTYDPDGFEDISKVLLVIGTSKTEPVGDAFGVDMDERRLISGRFNQVFEAGQARLIRLDTGRSSFEGFSSLVRFYPDLRFGDGADKAKLYAWMVVEDKYLGTKATFEREFDSPGKSFASINAISLYRIGKNGEIRVRASIPDAPKSFSSAHIDTHSGSGTCTFVLASQTATVRQKDCVAPIAPKVVLSDDGAEISFQFPLPEKGAVSAQAFVVLNDGFRSDLSRSGPLDRKTPELPLSYVPDVRPAADYLRFAASHRTDKHLYDNSSVVLMRANMPLDRPEWMSTEQFKDIFPNPSERYTSYPYLVYPIDFDIWSYSRLISAHKPYVKSISFSVDTMTLNFTGLDNTEEDLNRMAAVNFDGKPDVTAPWMANFPFRQMMSAAREPYFDRLFRGLDQAVAHGADTIQLDGYPNGGVMVSLGGDFSPESMRKFTAWLQHHTTPEHRKSLGLPVDLANFNYHQWLIENGVKTRSEYMAKLNDLPATGLFRSFNWDVAVEAYRRIREHLNEISPKKYIPLTSNGAPDWFAPSAYAYNSVVVDGLSAEVHFFPREGLNSLNAIYAYQMAGAIGVQLAAVPKGEENFYFSRHLEEARGLLPSYIAESYAFGQRIMVPWSYWMKGTDRRFFDDPQYYQPYFKFIADHRDLFDGLERVVSTGIIVRYGTEHAKTQKIMRYLLERDVPFALIIADDKVYSRQLKRADVATIDDIVVVDPIYWYDHADQSVLVANQHKVDFDGFIAPVRSSDPNIYVVPWSRPDGSEQVIHLLNRDYDSSAHRVIPKAHVSLAIDATFLGSKCWKSKYYEPGTDSLDLRMEKEGSKWHIEVPRLSVWGIVKLSKSACNH